MLKCQNNWKKIIKNAKNAQFSEGQTELLVKSILLGQKLAKNAKIPKLIWDILSNFQTMCSLIKAKGSQES